MGNGERQRPRLTHAQEKQVLESNEAARRRAMGAWYGRFAGHVFGLLTDPGFPAHRSVEEKTSSVVGLLMGLTGKILASEIQKGCATAREAAEDFRKILEDQVEAGRQERSGVRRSMMASVVAARILDAELPDGAEALEEPWRAAFGKTTEEAVELVGDFWGLLMEKLGALKQFSQEGRREGYMATMEELRRGEAAPAAKSNVVPLVDPRKVLAETRETIAKIEAQIRASDELVIGPEAG